APEGTVALIDVAERTVKLVALTFPKLTDVAPMKPEPEIMTIVPTRPPMGEKLVIFGKTVKLSVLVTVPPAVVTLIGPVTADKGTVALIDVGERMAKELTTPPNFTDITPEKLVPEIVTLVPTRPLVGVKLSTVGETPKLVRVEKVPAGAVTVMCPVVA